MTFNIEAAQKDYDFTKGAIRDFKVWLLSLEREIAHGINDFNDLRNIFYVHFGRGARK